MSETVDDEITASPAESNDALIAIAKAHGYTVSKRQLAEWHRAGLLPEPEQIYGERLGSGVVYPPGTEERLLALCEARKRHPRSMEDTAWSMWWQGLDVPMHFVRDLLNRVVARWGEGTRAL